MTFPRNRSRAACLLAAAVAALVPAQVSAQQGQRQYGDLRIIHRTSDIQVVTASGTISTDRLAAQNGYYLRPSEIVEITIQDPNPLLFNYEAGPITTTPAANYAQALAFARSLAGVPPAAQQAFDPSTPPGPCDQVFRRAVAKVREHANSVPSLIKQSAGSAAQVDDVKNTVDGWQLDRLAGEITPCYESQPASMYALLGRLKELQAAILDADRVRALARDELTTLATKLKAMMDTWPAEDAITRARLLELADAVDYALPGAVDTAANDGPRLIATTLNALIAKAVQDDLLETLELLRNFAADVARIDVPLTLTTVRFSKVDDQSTTVKITVNPDNAKDAESTKRSTGSFVFQFQPYSKYVVKLGPAYVYSFVPQPQFNAQKQEDGTFKIVQEANEFTESTVAGMLSFMPRDLYDQGPSWLIQTGFSPVKNKVAFYLGGGLSLTDVFLFAGGVTYQQVQTLEAGVVGDTIAEQAALRLGTKFAPGAYFAITLTLPSGG